MPLHAGTRAPPVHATPRSLCARLPAADAQLVRLVSSGDARPGGRPRCRCLAAATLAAAALAGAYGAAPQRARPAPLPPHRHRRHPAGSAATRRAAAVDLGAIATTALKPNDCTPGAARARRRGRGPPPETVERPRAAARTGVTASTCAVRVAIGALDAASSASASSAAQVEAARVRDGPAGVRRAWRAETGPRPAGGGRVAHIWRAGALPSGAGVAGGLMGLCRCSPDPRFCLGPAWHVGMCVFRVALWLRDSPTGWCKNGETALWSPRGASVELEAHLWLVGDAKHMCFGVVYVAGCVVMINISPNHRLHVACDVRVSCEMSGASSDVNISFRFYIRYFLWGGEAAAQQDSFHAGLCANQYSLCAPTNMYAHCNILHVHTAPHRIVIADSDTVSKLHSSQPATKSAVSWAMCTAVAKHKASCLLLPTATSTTCSTKAHTHAYHGCATRDCRSSWSSREPVVLRLPFTSPAMHSKVDSHAEQMQSLRLFRALSLCNV